MQAGHAVRAGVRARVPVNAVEPGRVSARSIENEYSGR
jgi:hypothetical protein